jgi:8-oxo-dGTP pyrophosphatase MutT (NUDIX family)
MRFDDALRERISAELRSFARQAVVPGERRHAAVALALVAGEGGAACVVLTRRPLDLPRHPGQYALPGGRLELGEDEAAAARRELREEVGLDTDAAAVLGILDDYATRSGFVITPVVVWARSGELRPDAREVRAVYRVPLAELARDEILHLDTIPESDRPVLSIDIVGTRIFSPTAAIFWQFREVALFGRSTRVAHFEQPTFAWR